MQYDLAFTDQNLLELIEGIRATEGFTWEEAEDHAVMMLMMALDIKKNGVPRHGHIWTYVETILTAHIRMVGRFREVN